MGNYSSASYDVYVFNSTRMAFVKSKNLQSWDQIILIFLKQIRFVNVLLLSENQDVAIFLQQNMRWFQIKDLVKCLKKKRTAAKRKKLPQKKRKIINGLPEPRCIRQINITEKSKMKIQKEIDFILAVDALKNVQRRNYNADDSRRENTAEHSWQIIILAQILYPYAKTVQILIC
jgi:hypothetical protein